MEWINQSIASENAATCSYKSLINSEFSKKATLYDSVAVVQRRIADRVVEQALIALQQRMQCRTFLKEQRDQASLLQILDAGCGTGYVGAQLAGIFAERSRASLINSSSHSLALMGLDLSDEMLEQAKLRGVYTAFIQGDIEALPFQKQRFHLVVSSLAIQWCQRPEQALSELVRVARRSDRTDLAKEVAKDNIKENIKEGVKETDTAVACIERPASVIVTTLLEGTLQELSAAFATIDQDQHILEFVPESQMREIVHAKEGTLTVYQEVVQFDTLKMLFQSLKNIGATALRHRRKGLLGRRSYQQLERYFQALGGYQLTYVVGLIEIP